jgi:hypothetical protein
MCAPLDLQQLSDDELEALFFEAAAEEWRRWKHASDTRPKGVPIKKILTAAVCTAFLALPLAGCVLDVNRLASDLKKPKVVFPTPAAERCEREKSTVPTADGRLEPRTICTNIARTPQALTINKAEHSVPAQGHVAMCETSAFVSMP